MLLHEKKPDLALSQIDHALSRGASLRVLHHTKGEVLKKLALANASADVARKYMVRSEESYRKAQSLGSRDPYPLQGLADLFLEWAKRASDQNEAADYLTKAQEVINRGLLEVRDKEGLWIISSKIQDWLGDRPGAIEALSKAAVHAPDSSVSRYLLGRTYHRRGSFDRVIETLAPLIKADPNNYQACLLYAESLLRSAGSKDEAVAILRMGNLYGLRDPRYVATLGGLLVLSGKLTEADEIFSRGRAMEFGIDELRSNLFTPTDSNGARLAFDGIVSRAMPGFVWISVPGMPEFWAFGSKFGGVVARKGLKVRFTPSFSARGTFALAVRPVSEA